MHVADREPVTGDQDRTLSPRVRDLPVEGGQAVLGGREGAGRHHADVPTGQRAPQPPDVVGVEVRRDDQRQRGDPQPVEAPVDGRTGGTGVDQHPGVRAGGQHDGVALADVADHGEGVRWRPAADGLAERPSREHEAHHGGQRQRAQHREAQQGDPHHEQLPAEQHRATETGRPRGRGVRQRGGDPRRGGQPARRPAGEPDHDVGGR